MSADVEGHDQKRGGDDAPPHRFTTGEVVVGETVCPDCDGLGRLDGGERCAACGGTGRVTEPIGGGG